MTTIIYFDICALILMAVVIFSIIFRKMTSGIQNRLFILLVSVIFADIVFDLWAVAMDTSPNYEQFSANARYISHAMYLTLRNITIPVYTLYVISLTDTWHKIKGSALMSILIVVPCALILILIAINPMTDKMFIIDENLKYVRGPHMKIPYVTAVIYCSIGIIYLLKHRKLFTGGKLASLIVIYPLTLAAAIIQWFNPIMLVELFFTSVAVMLITITVQRPEELIDSMTGVGKYTAYATTMKRNFTNEKSVRIIFINISNYFSLRSVLGYDFSTEMLKRIADQLTIFNKENKAKADVFYLDNGRYRIVFDENDWDKVDVIAKRINSEMKRNIIINQMELNLIAYVCITRCPEDISDFKTLMSFGNELCNIPFSGRVLNAGEIIEKTHFQLNREIDKIIEDGLAGRKFSVYYQPIFSVEQQRFVSAEALLRLVVEPYGFIPPDVFITAAERSGAIHRIGDYVFEEVCQFIASDEFKNLGLDYIEINLSVAQCMQTDLADKVLQTMKRYGVTPDKINLEITETAASYAQNIMMSNLEKLTSSGVNFSLDDYGTGYSNIKSVASLPVTIVKLDKTFVDEEDNPRMWIVLKNTIKMLKDMDMQIVVEGIENAELVKKFSELNCEFIQGYYYSRPIPRADFVEFMMSKNSMVKA